MASTAPRLEAAAPILLVSDGVAMAAHFRDCPGCTGDGFGTVLED